MIRDRFKKAVRSAAVRLLDMEFDTADRNPTRGATRRAVAGGVDVDRVPKVVDGAGDTPGPNHKAEIGRTWLAAQVVGGGEPVVVDVRPADELAGGWIPGAVRLPGRSVEGHLGRLPQDRSLRITVYDQAGAGVALDVAAWLRDQGFTTARALRGGFAEWLEHGEPVERASSAPAPGDPCRLPDGRTGWVVDAGWAWADGALVPRG